jgi:hypothetical protein
VLTFRSSFISYTNFLAMSDDRNTDKYGFNLNTGILALT